MGPEPEKRECSKKTTATIANKPLHAKVLQVLQSFDTWVSLEELAVAAGLDVIDCACLLDYYRSKDKYYSRTHLLNNVTEYLAVK